MFYANVASRKMFLRQGDFKSAFLQGDFSDDVNIFMRMPLSWEAVEGDNNALKLDRPLYGAKQASREFYLALSNRLVSTCGLTISPNDECFFFQQSELSTTFLVLHVDDFLLATTDESTADALITTLKQYFEFSKIGPPDVFLGYEINYDQSAGVLELRLSAYFREILKRADMLDCNPTLTPMDPTVFKNLMSKSTSPQLSTLLVPEQAELYSACTCSLLWASQRFLDLQFPVHYLARTLHAPTTLSKIILKSVLRYVAGRVDKPLRYGGEGSTLELISFGDASWGGEPGSRSQSGGLIMCGGAAIDSYSNVQPVVAMSSFEAELYQTAVLAQRVLYARHLAIDYGNKPTNPTALCIDNHATINLVNGSVGSSKSKHLRIRLHALRGLIASREIKTCYCPGDKLPADMLTKFVGRVKHQEQTNMALGL
jgi:Reverse transcriptase (RNA-dependent DNA polymerase)